MNRKISNAETIKYGGINFRSKLEVDVYKNLISLGITPEYETKTFDWTEGFTPTIPFYTKDTFSKTYKAVTRLPHRTCIDMRTLKPNTYTPDFYFEYNGKKIIVEVKGFPNDVFPYKFKRFRYLMENLSDKENYEIWEVFSVTQLKECIKHLCIQVSNQ